MGNHERNVFVGLVIFIILYIVYLISIQKEQVIYDKTNTSNIVDLNQNTKMYNRDVLLVRAEFFESKTCQHCPIAKPMWEMVRQHYKSEKLVLVKNIICEDEPAMCSYALPIGMPCIRTTTFFVDGSRMSRDFLSTGKERSVKNFIAFIEEARDRHTSLLPIRAS